MNRLLKIVIYLIIMALLFFWITRSMSGCNNNGPNLVDNIEQTVDGATDDLLEDGTEDESLFEDGAQSEVVDYTALDEVIDNSFDNKEDQNQADTQNDIEYVPPSSTSSSNNSSTYRGSGGYLIIAGSYLIESNAGSMVRKLNNMGYSGEKLKFDNSEYHTVIAGRYSDYGDAVDASSALKNKGIDCYVHRKKN